MSLQNFSEIGIVGFGVFGQFMCKYLRAFAQISVFDVNLDLAKTAAGLDVQFTSLEHILSLDVLILAIPVQYQEEFWQKYATRVNPQTLVLDVSSVKIKPIELMSKYLPSTCQILGTHPLFGPFSGKDSVSGLKCVLCPVRIQPEVYEAIKTFLEQDLKLLTLERTPEEHDKQIAYVQALTFFLGKAINQMDIPDPELKTPTYEYLLNIKRIVGSDTDDLFKTIQLENLFAKEVRQEFLQKLIDLENLLDG